MVSVEKFNVEQKTVLHKLTHKNLTIHINKVSLKSLKMLMDFAQKENFVITNLEESHQKSFPKPLENYLASIF